MGTVGVVDYAAGNLTSVETALKRLQAVYIVSSSPAELSACDKLIFPGVGEARAAMGELHSRGLDKFLASFIESGKPLLGICIGCQILLSSSEENDTECLDIIPGRVLRFPKDSSLKVPHMGWNEVYQVADSPLFDGVPDGTSFYFVHSYYPSPGRGEDIVGESEYGIRFTAAYSKKNVHAVQFHPEKSGEWGIQLLSNFLSMDG